MSDLGERLATLVHGARDALQEWSRRNGFPLPVEFDYWAWSGLPRDRATFRLDPTRYVERLDVTVKSERPLGIELSLWKRDSRLGEPERRVVLPEALGGAYRATSREPKLCARLFTQEIIDALLTMADNADGVEIRDDGALLGFDIRPGGFAAHKQRALVVLHLVIGLLDSLDEQRRLLPRSDYAPEVARVWAEFAARRDGVFDDLAETLLLATGQGELRVRVIDVARHHGTLLELGFARPLPIDFELCDRAELGWMARLRPPLLSAADRGVALAVRGGKDGASAALGPEAGRALVELRAASQGIHLSADALSSRHDHVLTDEAELDRALELVLDAASALCSTQKQPAGPYR